MQGLALLALLLSEHNSFHWEMSCAEWNQNRIEILSDQSLNADAKEYLIDYFRVKYQMSNVKPLLLDASKPTRNGSFIPYD